MFIKTFLFYLPTTYSLKSEFSFYRTICFRTVYENVRSLFKTEYLFKSWTKRLESFLDVRKIDLLDDVILLYETLYTHWRRYLITFIYNLKNIII